MRIISGIFRSRLIEYPCFPNKVRPTMDRVREGIFNAIRDDIKDKLVLDLFAGSGAYGLEAISNGAKSAVFVDNFKESIKIINKNLSSLKILNYQILYCDYLMALQKLKDENVTFDLIFVDPPYKFDIYNDVIEYCLINKIISDDGIFVLESNRDLIIKQNEHFMIKRYSYADTIVYILRRKK